MDNAITVIELFREDMKFSAAHFTIFSETERERLHGHNFQVHAKFFAKITSNDLAFDYTVSRKEIIRLCRTLNELCLIPTRSPHLKIDKSQNSYHLNFNGSNFVLPKEDVFLMPLENITTEGLSKWFVKEICSNSMKYALGSVESVTIKVSTGPGQYASASGFVREFG